MDITVQTPQGWQAPVFQPLAQQSIVPVQSAAAAMASGVQTGLALGAPLAHAGEAIASGIVNGPLNQAQRQNALAEAKLQGRTLTRQGRIMDIQDQYLNSDPTGTGAAAPSAPLSSAPAPNSSAGLPPLPQADAAGSQGAVPPLLAAPAPNSAASAPAQAAPASIPPAPASIAIPQGGPSPATYQQPQGWRGIPFQEGSALYNDSKFGPGYYGVVKNGQLMRTAIPTKQITTNNAATGQQTLVTTDEMGHVLNQTPLMSGQPKAEQEAVADFQKGLSTSLNTSREGLQKLDQLMDALHNSTTGPIEGMTPAVFNPRKQEAEGLSKAVVGLAKTIPGSRFTNMDFTMLEKQIPGVHDTDASMAAKANDLRDAFLSNIERGQFVQGQVANGVPLTQAQAAYDAYHQANPIVKGGQITRTAPTPPPVIQAYSSAPQVSSAAQYASLPSGSPYKDDSGVVKVKP